MGKDQRGYVGGPDFLEYLKDADYNLWISFLRDPNLVQFFSRIDDQMLAIVSHMNKTPDLTAKDYFFYQTAFWVMANRQLRNSFAATVRRMSYDAKLILRPALESTVFAYRIFENPKLLEVWANKREDWKAYAREFVHADYPAKLPRRTEFENYIDRFNDTAAHPNLNYFAGSAEFGDGVMHLHYFDRNDEQQYYLQLLEVLACGLLILEVMRKTLEDRFRIYLTSTEAEWIGLQHDFAGIKVTYRKRYNLDKKSDAD